MTSFDWTNYSRMLKAKGYDIQLKKDNQGIVRGYTIRKGNSIYKSSLLGNSRNLMPSKIEHTWAKLHPKSMKEQTTGIIQDKSSKSETHTPMLSKPIISSVGSSYNIEVEDKLFKFNLPHSIQEVFNKVFTDSENLNITDLAKVAALLFMGYLDAATSIASSSGGGGSPGTGWGKDKDEDERNWALRCARMAKWLCKPMSRGRKR